MHLFFLKGDTNMKIIILHNDGCSFRLKNGKEIILKGHHEINELSNDDFNNLLEEYPHLKIWEEKGFISFNEKKQDNLKADNAMNDEKKETERNEKAVNQAVETVKKATDKK